MDEPLRPAPTDVEVAWSDLGGSGSPGLRLDAADVLTVELPFRRPVRTAAGTHMQRPLVLVRLEVTADGSEGPVELVGWGECAALTDTTYDSEDAGTAAQALVGSLVPALLERSGAGGGLPGPSAVTEPGSTRSEWPLATAALEMAVADAHLRASGRSFAGLLGVDAGSVPVGAVVGLEEDDDDLVGRVAALVDAGYGRVKLKIGPGRDVGPVGAVRRRFPGLVLMADANGAYTPAELDHLVSLDRFGLACLEQPFGRTDLATHAELARRSSTPVCLDETVGSPADVRRAIGLGACGVVCVKPSRLGGVAAALEVHRDAAAAGIPLWIGGMYESGYARSVNAVLAALPGFSLPGDLAPASVALGEDLVPDPVLEGRPLRVPLHRGPGMGPAPDGPTVDRLSRSVTRLAP